MTKTIIIFILIQSFCIAQTAELGNTIYLDEVAVYNDSNNNYRKKYKTKGKQNCNISTSINSTFFTLIKKPPRGVIKSIKFFLTNENIYKLKM